MQIRELTLNEFEQFSRAHELSNFHQSLSYALLKAEEGYEYEIIGYCDDDQIYAAGLVLVKLLAGYLYAYIPEGFLIDYSNLNLLQKFTEDLYYYYKKEGISFIKINPPIVIGTVDKKTGFTTYNDKKKYVDNLLSCGFIKLDDNVYFESILPRFNAFVDLDEFSFDKMTKNAKNKVRKAIRKGLSIEIADSSKLDTLNLFIKNMINKDKFHYKDYFNIYSREHAIDYFLVNVDYQKYVINCQDAYNKELKNNDLLNQKVRLLPKERNVNKKMNSDKTLLAYKDDISFASKFLSSKEKDYIAGALVIKHEDTISILISGFDKNYSSFAANYYLYYEILKYYKNEYKYANLNGITGNFDKNSPYYGLNQFKMGFNPVLYEYIGEFDLVIDKANYKYLYKKGLLYKEFSKN